MVEFVAVTRSYRLTPWTLARPALERFSLRVAAGQMVAILGANGSGKSTALRIAAGLLRPTAGTCRLWGSERPDPAMNRKIGYVPDVCDLPGFLTVGEVLSVAARLGGLGRVAEPDALMRVGLEGKACAARRGVNMPSRPMIDVVGTPAFTSDDNSEAPSP